MLQENKNTKPGMQDKGDGPRKGFKFNPYWVYAIIAIILLSAQFMRFAPDLTRTTEQEFKQKNADQGRCGEAGYGDQ